MLGNENYRPYNWAPIWIIKIHYTLLPFSWSGHCPAALLGKQNRKHISKIFEKVISSQCIILADILITYSIYGFYKGLHKVYQNYITQQDIISTQKLIHKSCGNCISEDRKLEWNHMSAHAQAAKRYQIHGEASMWGSFKRRQMRKSSQCQCDFLCQTMTDRCGSKVMEKKEGYKYNVLFGGWCKNSSVQLNFDNSHRLMWVRHRKKDE